MNGVNPQYVIAGIGVLIIIGIAGYSALGPSAVTTDEPVVAVSGPEGTEEVATVQPSETTTTPKPTTPKPTSPTPNPSTGAGSPAAPSTPAETPAAPPESTPPVAPTAPTAPAAYNPGFQASTRVHPGIPSENERATLPSCDGKKFTIDPVNFGAVTSITANGSFSGVAPHEYAVIRLNTTGTEAMYDLTAPQDVWVTSLVQESGLSVDSSDTTIYFALCKDVIGYTTHIKELSTQTYKILTDSYCFGKPHTGPNACKIEILQLIGGGSSLGKVGRLEGAFGLGVIDLRTERGLMNPSVYSVITNFARCPFSYFTNAEAFNNKLTGTSDLCVQ
ncbi:MAG: hypothetical protein AAB955_03565 [Patescibacteria group bacterium]